MSLEQTLDGSNNTNIATNHNMAGWSTAQKMAMDVQHSARNDKKAELEYSNAINQNNLANHSALDQLNNTRTMDRLIMGALANKLLNLEPDDAVAASELMKGSANASLVSILSQLAGGSIANKTASITPPETGLSSQIAQLNALNAQNYQNQASSSALANALTSATAALAGIYTKNLYNTPPVGTSGSPHPTQV